MAAAAGVADPQTVADSATFVQAFTQQRLEIPADIQQLLDTAGAASQASVRAFTTAASEADRQAATADLTNALGPLDTRLDDWFIANCDGMTSGACRTATPDQEVPGLPTGSHDVEFYGQFFEAVVAAIASVPGCPEAFVPRDGTPEHPIQALIVDCTPELEGAIGLGGDSLVTCTDGEWIP